MNRTYGECKVLGRLCLFHVHGQDGMVWMSLVGEFFHQHESDFDACVEVVARQRNGRLVQPGNMLVSQ